MSFIIYDLKRAWQHRQKYSNQVNIMRFKMFAILTLPPLIFPIFFKDNCIAKLCSSMSVKMEAGADIIFISSSPYLTDTLMSGYFV